MKTQIKTVLFKTKKTTSKAQIKRFCKDKGKFLCASASLFGEGFYVWILEKKAGERNFSRSPLIRQYQQTNKLFQRPKE